MRTDEQRARQSNAHSPATREIFAFLPLHLFGETQAVQEPSRTSFSLRDNRHLDDCLATPRSLLYLRQDRPDVHRYRAAVLGILESEHTIEKHPRTDKEFSLYHSNVFSYRLPV